MLKTGSALQSRLGNTQMECFHKRGEFMSSFINLLVIFSIAGVTANCSSSKFAANSSTAKKDNPKPVDKGVSVAADVNSDNSSPSEMETGAGVAAVDDGKWYQAKAESCTTLCTAKGLKSAPEPGTQIFCISGEMRPENAIKAGIVFTFGAWRDASPVPNSQYAGGLKSEGIYCWSPGQKRDNDKTDKTVGCYCSH